MNICVYGASSDLIDREYIKDGELLGEEIARRGHSLIFGGGACGLMGAVARGAARNSGEIIGIAPSFFNVDGVLFDKCTNFIFTETMRERKQTMENMADAFIMTPGGIGTYEEYFEILTLKQLGRHNKAITILNTSGYYDILSTLMKNTCNKNFMKEESLSLSKSFTQVNDLLDYLENYIPTEINIHNTKHIK